MPDSVTEHFKHSPPATVCHHISRLLQCRAYYLNVDDSVRCTFAFGKPSSLSDDGGLMCALFGGETIHGRPSVKAARPGEIYIAVDLFDNGAFFGRLAVGPILSLTRLISEHGAQTGAETQDFETAASAAACLYHFVYGEWLDEKALLVLCSEGRQTGGNSGVKKTERTSTPQVEKAHHHSTVYENHIYSQISDGNETKLLEIIKAPPDGAYGLLDREHPLRNIKNDCICIITLAARAAIAGGLDSETAFSMSDEAIQEVEKHRDIDGLYQLIVKSLCGFTRRVEETKRLNYSYRINRCRNYVQNHIYDKLTISELAAPFGISSEYLSEQFRKETGGKLIDFINTSRAEEAKRLLLFTDRPILEIASLLNYYDQSHFTKSFKRVFGITPGGVRESRA